MKLRIGVVHVPGRLNLVGAAADLWSGRCISIGVRRGLTAISLAVTSRRARVLAVNASHAAIAARLRGAKWPTLRTWMLTSAQTSGAETSWSRLVVLWGRVPSERRLASSGALSVVVAWLAAEPTARLRDVVEGAFLTERMVLRREAVSMGRMDQVVPCLLEMNRVTLIDLGRVKRLATFDLPNEARLYLRPSAARGAALGDTPFGQLGVSPFDDLESLVSRRAEGAVLRNLAEHAEREEANVSAAAIALSQNDPVALGRAIDASHVSSSALVHRSPRSQVELERNEVRSIRGVVGVRRVGSGRGAPLLVLATTPIAALAAWEVRPAGSFHVRRVEFGS